MIDRWWSVLKKNKSFKLRDRSFLFSSWTDRDASRDVRRCHERTWLCTKSEYHRNTCTGNIVNSILSKISNAKIFENKWKLFRVDFQTLFAWGNCLLIELNSVSATRSRNLISRWSISFNVLKRRENETMKMVASLFVGKSSNFVKSFENGNVETMFKSSIRLGIRPTSISWTRMREKQ